MRARRKARRVRKECSPFGPSGGGFAVMLPFAGEDPAATDDFKMLALFESQQAMGDAFDRIYTDGGGQVAQMMMNPVMRCDSARLYNETVIRAMQQPG